MALTPLASALAAFGAGLAAGVAAVTAVAVTIGRAMRRPPNHHRPPDQHRPRRPAPRGYPDLAAEPVRRKERRPASDRPDPVSPRDGGQLLADLECLGVTMARGPVDLVDRTLTTAATDLAVQITTRPLDLILAGFQEAAPLGATSCADLAAALDLVAANAVTVRRRLDDAPHETARTGQAAEPGASDPALTVLVSRVPPTPAELRLLVDLVTDPGGAAALLPARYAHSPYGAHVLELSYDRAGPDALAAALRAAAQPMAIAESRAAGPVVARTRAGSDRVGPRHGGQGQAGLRIGVLGPLTINGQPAALLPAQSQLIVALALHEGAGLSNRKLCHLLGADPSHPRPSDSLRQLIVRTRRQLGQADDGLQWVEHRGGGQYALHPAATVDWIEFEALTSRAIAASDADQLAVAMTMIRGLPFTGCFYWWLDLTLVETVRARVVDAAEMLASLSLAARDPAVAARAARTGLVADETAERLWRALMRAEHGAGNVAGVREAWTRCLHAIADIAADGQPEPATTAVYQQLGGR